MPNPRLPDPRRGGAPGASVGQTALLAAAGLGGALLLAPAPAWAGSGWTPPPPALPAPPPGSTCVLIQRGLAGNVWESDLAPSNGNWAAGAYPLTWTGYSQSMHWSVYTFDLSPVPQGAQIALAAFTTSVGWNDKSSVVRVHRVLVPWEESTVTWNNFGGEASWDPAVIATFDPSGVGYKTVEVTDVVQSWHAGLAPAYGLLMEEDPAKVHGFYASESSTATYRPSLYVCYVAGGPCAGLSEGAACDDGNLCTVGETCVAGQCASGAPVGCAPLDGCHEAGVCDPATGQCTTPEKPDGAACSDNDLCTTDDVCMSGLCVGGTLVTCFDGDACTVDVCDPASGCVSSTVSCDDGDACTADTCDPVGGCAHAPVSCDDGDACTTDTCDPATGCGIAPVSCDDGDACTVDGCDQSTGCVYTALSCGDGDACTTDTCDSQTGCSFTPLTCAAQDACHVAGTCDPATGQCTNPAAPNGTACDDGNACTQGDTCQSGSCTGANPVACSAQDQCHEAGTCDPATGQCSNPAKADGASCDDGDACTQSDTCQSGSCTGANPVTCVALDECHVAGSCDPATGQCTNPDAPDGTACDDGNACTENDSCQSGACTSGTPVTCAAQDACSVAGSCDPATGCSSEPLVCDDALACTVDSCNPAGGCEHVISCPVGQPCSQTFCSSPAAQVPEFAWMCQGGAL